MSHVRTKSHLQCSTANAEQFKFMGKSHSFLVDAGASSTRCADATHHNSRCSSKHVHLPGVKADVGMTMGENRASMPMPRFFTVGTVCNQVDG